MNTGTKIIIYNESGDTLYSEVINSPFLALQTGETFWFGDPSEKKWATLLKVIYGLNTKTKEFVVTLYVQESEKKLTKEFTAIDIGDGILLLKENEDWFSKDRKVRVILSQIYASGNRVAGIVIQLEHSNKTEISSHPEWLSCGQSFEAKMESVILKFTLIKTIDSRPEIAEFKLTLQ